MKVAIMRMTLTASLLTGSLFAQSDSDETDNSPLLPDFTPNTTLRERVFVFGSSPESAERAAMVKAWEISRKGVFKVKGIGLGSADGEDYCILSIEHEIFQPPDTKRVGESAVGFGENPRSAIRNSYLKAMQRIRENPRARPNLKSSTLPPDIREIMPMPKSDERDFIISQIRLWGRNSNWRCYLTFEYLEMK